MNNTTKGKYELAKKMLVGQIDVDEVVLMTGLAKDEILKIKETVNPKQARGLSDDLDVTDFKLDQVLIDNYGDASEEEFEEYFNENANTDEQ